MINGVMLAWYSAGGGTIGDILSQWEQAGFFSYLLPFLLIFALVFGILIRTQIFKDNKAVNAIIALAVALMSLQFDFVPIFFSEIFPRLGVGLAVILMAIIVLGLFMSNKNTPIMFILAAIVGIVVLIKSFGATGWTYGLLDTENIGWIILTVLGIIAFFAVINSVGPKGPSEAHDSILGRALLGKG